MAQIPVGTFWSTNSLRIQEILNKNIEEFFPALDPIWERTVTSSSGVVPVDQIGRDLKIIKLYHGSLAGVLEQGGPYGDFSLYGDANDNVRNRLYTRNVTQVYPDPFGSPNPRPFRLGIPMRSMVFNMPMSLDELRAEAIPAVIGEIVEPRIRGAARNVAHTYCNYWWLDPSVSYALASLGSTSISDHFNTGQNDTVSFEPVNKSTERFAIGQRVQIFADNSGAPDTSNPNKLRTWDGSTPTAYNDPASIWFVVAVDHNTNTVYLQPADPSFTYGTSSINTAGSTHPIDGDHVLYANSVGSAAYPSSTTRATGVAGINAWLKTGSGSSNTFGAAGAEDNFLLGGEGDADNAINVHQHPEFKSMGFNNGGQPLTEHRLRQIVQAWERGKRSLGQTIDTFAASDGVWLAYEAQKIGREILDRTGRLSSLSSEGSSGDFLFTMNGRKYRGVTSAYIESGTVYGIKTSGNNWKRMVPPRTRGARGLQGLTNFLPFEFVGGALTGSGSHMLPVFITNSSNQTMVTQGVQMPADLRLQLVPDQPTGIKLTNVAEDRLYPDN